MSEYNTIFDDAFRTMLERMPSLIIPVINEVFRTSYSEDEKIEQYRNEHHTVSGEVVTDSYLGIRDKFYHVECQSTQDSRMSIRMIEYDFAIALERAQEKNDSFELNFPHSCVLYLRHDGNTPEHLRVKVNMPDGEQVNYQVPTVKVQEYTRDEIFRKRLLFFLPFYIMRYEKELKGISENSSRLEELVGEYEGIREQLGDMLVREEKMDLYLRLMGVIKEISNYMLRQEGPAQERMGKIMGGKVLELEADRILERIAIKRQEVERFIQEAERFSQEVESRSQEVESRSQEVESRSQEV
ncbi:MAG: hypothetical protein NC392_15670, partial [Roseburia sp.]|nr:hypothetical protein [Roseburia sp.]